MAASDSLWISYAPDRYSKTWKNVQISWAELCKRLRVPRVTAETFAEYRAMTKEAQADRKDVGGFVGGPITGGRRLARNITCRSLITLDIDYATAGFWTEFTLKYDCAAFLYATHSSSPEKPRLRLIIPLSREVLPDQYEAIARRVAGDLDIEIIDPKSFEVQQLMYWPSVSSDVPYYYEEQQGPSLEVDLVLSTYRDWKDSSQWPMSVKVIEEVKRAIGKQANPLEKTGVVGAFCRTYNIPAVIDKYLPEIYLKTDHEYRYTYSRGSTASGLVVHDDGIFAYTHHQTDPIRGHLCNAFDLVRLHLYGDLDAEIEPRTPIGKQPSFIAMREEAAKDETVSRVLTEERLAGALEAFEDWTEQEKEFLGKIKKDKQGNVFQTIENCRLILENDPNLKGCFCRDEFRKMDIVTGPIPWRLDAQEGDLWEDSDLPGLCEHLEKYGINVVGKIEMALNNVFEANKKHPVREYLNTLKWDGTPRLDNLLVDYFGAEDSAYTKMVTRKTFVAAVARVFKPGIKFDTVLVLISEEGKNESAFIEKIGVNWSSADFGPLDNIKMAIEQLQGSWIIEIGELAGIRKSDIETVKHFITKTKDKFRKAYGKNPGEFKRQCIFIGTTNKIDFLNDVGKNRRFWPVQLMVTDPDKDVWEDLTPGEINQIWAEACVMYNSNEPLHLNTFEEWEAGTVRDRHREQDDRGALIKEYLESPVAENWDSLSLTEQRAAHAFDEGGKQRNKVSVVEIWMNVFNGAKKDATVWNVKFIRDYMDKLPEWESRVVKIGGQAHRGYVRLKTL